MRQGQRGEARLRAPEPGVLLGVNAELNVTDDVWELVNGPVADEIETLNRASQFNVAAALVKSLLARRDDGRPPIPDETALRLLHHAATLFLLEKPGRYRDFDMHVEEDGIIAFHAQHWRDVKRLVRRFFRDLAALWDSGDAIDVASFVLWRLTWIHPFRDGNGRTAIALSYACLCLKLGALLPGKKTMIDGIMADLAGYRNALRVADRGLAGPSGEPDLSALKAYLDDLLLRQMQSAESDDCV